MSYSEKDIKRSIRNFNRIIDDLYSAGHHVYQARVNDLMATIMADEILFSIIGPYLDREIDIETIENQSGGSWFHLRLPKDKDDEIAYVLQIMKLSAEGSFSIETYALHIFRQNKLNYNLDQWNKQILFPCLRVLSDKINDLLEDKVEGNGQISPSTLNLINSGTMQGNFAFGSNISQSFTIGEYTDQIIKKALENGAITPEQVESVKEVTTEIEEELSKQEPSRSKLRSLAGKLTEIGKQGLLAITASVITDPRWGQAAADVVFGLI